MFILSVKPRRMEKLWAKYKKIYEKKKISSIVCLRCLGTIDHRLVLFTFYHNNGNGIKYSFRLICSPSTEVLTNHFFFFISLFNLISYPMRPGIHPGPLTSMSSICSSNFQNLQLSRDQINCNCFIFFSQPKTYTTLDISTEHWALSVLYDYIYWICWSETHQWYYINLIKCIKAFSMFKIKCSMDLKHSIEHTDVT